MEEEWMQSRSQVYEERRKRVERVCANLQKHWVHKNPGREFIFDINYGLGYCRHGKVCTRRQTRGPMALKTSGLASKVTYDLGFGL